MWNGRIRCGFGHFCSTKEKTLFFQRVWFQRWPIQLNTGSEFWFCFLFPRFLNIRQNWCKHSDCGNCCSLLSTTNLLYRLSFEIFQNSVKITSISVSVSTSSGIHTCKWQAPEIVHQNECNCCSNFLIPANYLCSAKCIVRSCAMQHTTTATVHIVLFIIQIFCVFRNTLTWHCCKSFERIYCWLTKNICIFAFISGLISIQCTNATNTYRTVSSRYASSTRKWMARHVYCSKRFRRNEIADGNVERQDIEKSNTIRVLSNPHTALSWRW